MRKIVIGSLLGLGALAWLSSRGRPLYGEAIGVDDSCGSVPDYAWHHMRAGCELKPPTEQALLMSEDSIIVIYDPVAYRIAMEREDYEAMEDAVLGIYEPLWNEKHKAMEVGRIWAVRGYGPFLYRVAIHQAGSDGLIPYQDPNYVTKSAKNVWYEFSHGKGRPFVTPEPLSTKSHKEEYLSVRLRERIAPNIEPMIARHKRTMGRDPYEENLMQLVEVASSKGYQAMLEIYG